MMMALLFADVPETKLVLGKSLNPDNIRESSDVYYDCLVDANPPIYKVEWRHNVSTTKRFNKENIARVRSKEVTCPD